MSTITEPITVRLATRDDMKTIQALIIELAIFEGVPDGPKLSVEVLLRDGFDSSPPWFFALVAERGGEIVGYALCNRAYSSWTGRSMYLEDLYVKPAARRTGVAMKLFQRLCQMAVAKGVDRVDWHVLIDNETAIALYTRIGARDLRVTEGRTAMRLDGPAIKTLAEQN